MADEDLKKEASDMPSHAEQSTSKPEQSAAEREESTSGKEESASSGSQAASEGSQAASEGSQAAEDGSQASPEKGLSPAAIAKRLEALGDGESAEDKASRLEEEKLIERRANQKTKKKGKGKSGLQAAASRRLDEVGTKTAEKKKPRSTGTVSRAADFEGDALLETTDQITKWAKKNQKLVGIVAGVAAVVGLGFAGNWYFVHKKDTAASTALEAAVADERGRIGDPDKATDDEGPKDTSPIFKTPQDRQDAALAKFRDVTAKFPGTGAAYLARLSEGSLLLDKHDAAGAMAAFNDVKASPLAKVDQEVNGRALEGLGFAQEYLADNGDPTKYDDAIKTYRELENTDVFGFQELGMYHQARIYQKKGDTDKAKELLKSVYERVNKPGENHPFPFLENLTEDRLRALDPSALPPKPVNRMGGPAGNQMSEAQMRKLIEQMQRQQAAGGGGGGGGGGHHQ